MYETLAVANIVHRLGPAVISFDSSNPGNIENHQRFKAYECNCGKVCLAEKQDAKAEQKAELEKSLL